MTRCHTVTSRFGSWRPISLACFLAVLLLGATGTTAGAELTCEQGGLRLAAKYGKSLLLCESKAVRNNEATSSCPGQNEENFRKSYDKGTPDGCTDFDVIAGQTADAAASTVETLRPSGAASLCVAKKLTAAAKHWSGLFLARSKCIKTGIDCSEKFARLDEKLLSTFTKLDADPTCATTGDGETQRSRLGEDSSAVSTCILGTVQCEHVSSAVAAGGTATTDSESDGATSVDPVETTIESPGAGTITIRESVAGSSEIPGGFTLLGNEIIIEASDATAADPLRLTFVIDASVLPAGVPIDQIELFRDDVVVEDCAAATGEASPDPCVLSRTLLGGGDLEIVALSSHASDWGVGVTPQECTLSVRRIDSSAFLSLQYQLDYSASGINLSGSGLMTACSNQLPSSLFVAFDDESTSTLRIGQLTTPSVMPPSDLLECTFTALSPPDEGAFLIQSIDVADDIAPAAGGGVCGAPVTGQYPGFARDALHILQFAIGQPAPCELCECDANSSGSVTASDSLMALRSAVAPGSIVLNCGAACTSSTSRPPAPGSPTIVVTDVQCGPTTTTTTTTTLPILECDVEFSRTDTASNTAIQFDVDYSPGPAVPVGSGATAACTNLVGGTLIAFTDDEANQNLEIAIAGVSDFSTPTPLARCTFAGTTEPIVSITTIDSAAAADTQGGGNVCGAPDSGSSPPYARDASHILRKAVGQSVDCELCEGDVNNSGALTASDSLAVLKSAVGHSVTLSCPGGCGAPTVRGPVPGAASIAITDISCEPATTTTTTLPSDLDCTIEIGLTSATTAGALQLEVDYSGSGAEPVGTAPAVTCQNQIGSSMAAFANDEASQKLHLGFITLTPATGPVVLATCSFTAPVAPAPGTFVVSVQDSAVDADLLPGGRVCGAPITGATPPSARDSLQVLRAAVGQDAPCELCECDANADVKLTASDSLSVLRAAVGISTTLNCIAPCGESGTPHPPNGGSATAAVTSVSCGP
jgi:hypothetical protein